jgi:23S rRNA pseudouridine2605 synthase
LRLNRFLAQAGLCSRRAADELIAEGRVRVDGRTVRTLGTTIAENARVEVDGAVARLPLGKTYLVMNKPTGVMTTLRDPQGRRTVRDLLPSRMPRVVPVGRLDYETSGVLLLTNDGELTHRLLHPRFGVEKTYRARVDRPLSADDLRRLRTGVEIAPGERTLPCRVHALAGRKGAVVLEITLNEGRNRQVRRMLEAVGRTVVRLERIRFGPLALGELALGKTRFLTTRELAQLRRIGAGSRTRTPAGKASGQRDSRLFHDARPLR